MLPGKKKLQWIGKKKPSVDWPQKNRGLATKNASVDWPKTKKTLQCIGQKKCIGQTKHFSGLAQKEKNTSADWPKKHFCGLAQNTLQWIGRKRTKQNTSVDWPKKRWIGQTKHFSGFAEKEKTTSMDLSVKRHFSGLSALPGQKWIGHKKKHFSGLAEKALQSNKLRACRTCHNTCHARHKHARAVAHAHAHKMMTCQAKLHIGNQQTSIYTYTNILQFSPCPTMRMLG